MLDPKCVHQLFFNVVFFINCPIKLCSAHFILDACALDICALNVFIPIQWTRLAQVYRKTRKYFVQSTESLLR